LAAVDLTPVPALGRYFLALCPDSAARTALADVPLPPGAQPVHPDDLHLTVAFLGSLGGQGPQSLLAALAPACALPPPRVTLDASESWPGPRVFCAVGDCPDVAALAARLWQRLGVLGWVPEARPYQAHVTLARKLPAPFGPRVALPAPIRWQPGALVLMASTGRTGSGLPRYQTVASLPWGP
jgi:2'-5' RNA ligase